MCDEKTNTTNYSIQKMEGLHLKEQQIDKSQLSISSDEIHAEGLTFRYESGEGEPKAQYALKELDLTIRAGEFVAVLGHNGSGKSTFAKHLNGILLPSGGAVYVFGQDTREEEKLIPIRKNVGMVFQNPDNQIVAAVVEEDVAFGLENLGVAPEKIRERVPAALKRVGMYEFRGHSPSRLSGGQKQRVAIAGIIAMRPKCIVLDEPTAMLDPAGRKEVLDTIRMLNREEKITIVLITHYMDEAAKADRVVVLDDGKKVMDGPPAAIFERVEELKAIGLDIPQVTQLLYRLKRDGYPVRTNIIRSKEFVKEIRHLMEDLNVHRI